MQSITQQQIDAAQEFANTVVSELRTDKGVHAETAVASVARMAGTFLFRSFGFQLPDVEPGGVVLSEQANEAGPRLIQVLAGALAEIGVALDEQKLGATRLAGEPAEARLPGNPEAPRAAVLGHPRRGTGSRSSKRPTPGPSPRRSSCTSAPSVLDPNVAFGVAVYGFIEGTKTAPHPVVH